MWSGTARGLARGSHTPTTVTREVRVQHGHTPGAIAAGACCHTPGRIRPALAFQPRLDAHGSPRWHRADPLTAG